VPLITEPACPVVATVQKASDAIVATVQMRIRLFSTTLALIYHEAEIAIRAIPDNK
jgi:hypothetical protein